MSTVPSPDRAASSSVAATVDDVGPRDDASTPPISLYVHVPWCLRKCPYCDFNSVATRAALPESAYLYALLGDLVASLERHPVDRFVSVFFGGGTPSLLSPQTIAAVIDALARRNLIDSTTEITLEANPAAAQNARFHDFADAGVNRLSLGVQSFSSTLLARIGRIHDGNDARAALASAVQRFPRVNVDLMIGLPSQTLEQLDVDLDILLTTDVGHVSCYQLTIEPDTPFAKHPPTLPPESVLNALDATLDDRLTAAGFARYETAALAKPGQPCRHNLNYWQFGDYLGIGAGAHGKLTKNDRVIRTVRHSDPGRYIQHAPTISRQETLAPETRRFEALMNAARLVNGFDPRRLAENARLSPTAFDDAIDYAVQKGYWTFDEGIVAPTDLGRRFLNRLLTELP